MAKLYAELTSDKGDRIASKGGDGHINVKLVAGNRTLGHVTLMQGPSGNTIIRFMDSQKPYNPETGNIAVLQELKLT